MNPDIVRAIDFYVGIPLCFILTLWRFCKKIICGEPSLNPEDAKTVLFIELSEMGSTVIAAPAIKRFIDTYPDVEPYFLIFERNRESIDLLSLFKKENVLTVRDDNLKDFISDILDLFVYKRRAFDICFDLELFSRCTSILTYLSGAGAKIGFFGYYCEGLYRGHLLTHKVSYNPYKHMSLNFMALMKSLIMNCPGDPFDIEEDAIEEASCQYQPDLEAQQRLKYELRKNHSEFDENRSTVIVNPHPGDYLPIRGWGVEKYIDLCKKLTAEFDIQILIIGLEKHRHMGDAICENTDSQKCINYMGKTKSLSDVLELMTLSKAIVTNDSGPAHFAALTDSHIFTLFGPETPALYGPLSKKSVTFFSNIHCSPCLSAFNHRKTSCDNNICLQRIEVETVYSAMKKVLSANDEVSNMLPL